MQAVKLSQSQPWYREPWPYLLLAGPVAVIIAGAYTMIVAFSSADGMVVQDYYKQGMTINQTLARSEKAQQLGLQAVASYEPDGHRLRIQLTGQDVPDQLTLRLAHPIRAAMDQILLLKNTGEGLYETTLVLDATTAHWDVVLETTAWRLTARWHDPVHQSVRLGAVMSQSE